MEIVRNNQLIITIVVAWASAQIIKTIIYRLLYGTFKAERLIGSGGMPSSHSSTVCSLATAAFFAYGLHSFEFTISTVLAIIVMHDACNVRMETGKQSQLLNAILDLNSEAWEGEVFDKRLKELVGHTPLQVFVGALLGILIAVVIDMACFHGI